MMQKPRQKLNLDKNAILSDLKNENNLHTVAPV